jgi:DNA-binding CsgD family transcriptional regulator
MKNGLEELTSISNWLFPDQVKVYSAISLDEKKENNNMLHQHFMEPLSEVEEQELVGQIAGYLIKQDEGTVYSFFWANSKTAEVEGKWYVSSAKLKINEKETSHNIVIFTYDLALLGDGKEQLYLVLKNLDFLKKNYCKASLLTKREIEIMVLLANGKTSIEIGNELFISNHTVNTHRKNITKKLKTKNISELIKYTTAFDINSY